MNVTVYDTDICDVAYYTVVRIGLQTVMRRRSERCACAVSQPCMAKQLNADDDSRSRSMLRSSIEKQCTERNRDARVLDDLCNLICQVCDFTDDTVTSAVEATYDEMRPCAASSSEQWFSGAVYSRTSDECKRMLFTPSTHKVFAVLRREMYHMVCNYLDKHARYRTNVLLRCLGLMALTQFTATALNYICCLRLRDVKLHTSQQACLVRALEDVCSVFLERDDV